MVFGQFGGQNLKMTPFGVQNWAKLGPKMAENPVIYGDFHLNMSKTPGFCQKYPKLARIGPQNGRKPCNLQGVHQKHCKNPGFLTKIGPGPPFWGPKWPFWGQNWAKMAQKQAQNTCKLRRFLIFRLTSLCVWHSMGQNTV